MNLLLIWSVVHCWLAGCSSSGTPAAPENSPPCQTNLNAGWALLLLPVNYLAVNEVGSPAKEELNLFLWLLRQEVCGYVYRRLNLRGLHPKSPPNVNPTDPVFWVPTHVSVAVEGLFNRSRWCIKAEQGDPLVSAPGPEMQLGEIAAQWNPIVFFMIPRLPFLALITPYRHYWDKFILNRTFWVMGAKILSSHMIIHWLKCLGWITFSDELVSLRTFCPDPWLEGGTVHHPCH